MWLDIISSLNLFQVDTITFRAQEESDMWNQHACMATLIQLIII